MIEAIDLMSSCHVVSNEEGDRFVGLKVRSNGVGIFFPMGYDLSRDEEMLRDDVKLLIRVLSKFVGFEGMKDGASNKGNEITPPIKAYMDVIEDFYERNGHFFNDIEKTTHKGIDGKINWKKTIKTQKGFFSNGNYSFEHYIVEKRTPSSEAIITSIHKYCVYEAFANLGWLYSSNPVRKIKNRIDELTRRIYCAELKKRISNTFVDRERALFVAMLAIIGFSSCSFDSETFFGTYNFEYVWEKIIDGIFGVSNKEEFFPRAVWSECWNDRYRNETHALIPDTIMLNNEENGKTQCFILDAKYYRFGITRRFDHLPDTSSINKQITYGEYAAKKTIISKNQVYSAFLMPYNSNNNLFNKRSFFAIVVKGKGEWRNNIESYETIYGVLVDVKQLLKNYWMNHDYSKKALINTIMKAENTQMSGFN